MSSNLVIWGLYSSLSVSVATGVGVVSGVIPIDRLTGALGWNQPAEVAKPVALAAVPEPKKDVLQEPEKPVAKAPAFDLRRVEKDGSVLVAGSAEPNAEVELRKADGTILGTTTAGDNGDFVIAWEDSRDRIQFQTYNSSGNEVARNEIDFDSFDSSCFCLSFSG